MMRSRRPPFPVTLAVVLLCLVTLFRTVASAAATVRPTSTAHPIISLYGPVLDIPGSVIVRGVGFTPGSTVEVIAVVAQWGDQNQQTAEVTASRDRSAVSHYTGDGRPAGDPTYNSPGGMFLVEIDHLCGVQVTVQAYDRKADAWSNRLTFSPGCSNPDGFVPQSSLM